MAEVRTDFGPPSYKEMMPAVLLENYGKWAYHENPKAGILKHVSETGDVCPASG